MRGSVFFQATKAQQSTYHTNDSLKSCIQKIQDNLDSIYSYSHISSVSYFQSYLSAEYKQWSSKNEGFVFIQELFLATSLKNLNNNTLLYLVLMNAIKDMELGDKATRATKISRDLGSISPSVNPDQWYLLEKILLWISNPLGSSRHLILQPLRDLIWEWFFKQDDLHILSSIYLLNIFLKHFPSSLNSNFETAQSLVLRTLVSNQPAQIKLIRETLKNYLDLMGTQYESHTKLLFIDFIKYIQDKNRPLNILFMDALIYAFNAYPWLSSIIKFSSAPTSRLLSPLNEQSILAYAIFALVYQCCPHAFDSKFLTAVLEFHMKEFDTPSPFRRKQLKYLGQMVFLFDNKTCIANKRIIESLIQGVINNLDSKEAVYAFISMASPTTQIFCDQIKKVFAFAESKLVLKGLVKMCLKWPSKAPMLRIELLRKHNLTLLTRKHTQKVERALYAISLFRFTPDELAPELLVQYANNLKNPYTPIRRNCIAFLLAQQRCFQVARQRLIAFVAGEPSEELRLTAMKGLVVLPSDAAFIPALYGMLMDRQSGINLTAMTHLMKITGSTPLLKQHIAETVQFLKMSAGKLPKTPINVLLAAVENRPELLEPHRDYIIQMILEQPAPTAKSILLLLRLLDAKDIDSMSSKIISLILSGLSLHSTQKRLCATIDLIQIAVQKSNKFRVMIRTEYSSVFVRFIEAATGLDDKDVRIKYYNVLNDIGIIRQSDLPQELTAQNRKQNRLIDVPFSTTKPEQIISEVSLDTSLNIVCSVLEETALSSLHSKAIESLATILKNYRSISSALEKQVIDHLKDILVAGDPETISAILHHISAIVTVTGDCFAPLVPLIVDFVCANWGHIDTNVLLRAVNWLAYRTPQLLEPYFHQIASLLITSLPLMTDKVADDIFSLFVAAEWLLESVDYMVIPSLIQWISANFENTEQEIQTIDKFIDILKYVDVPKFATEIIRMCILIVNQNSGLIKSAMGILTVVAVNLEENFIVFLPEVVPYVNQSNDEDMMIIVQCLLQKTPIPQYLTESNQLESNRKPNPKLPSKKSSADMRVSSFTFKSPPAEWDATEWTHWADEFIPSFLIGSPFRSISSCVGLAERNTTIRADLFPIALAAIDVTSNDKNLENLISYVLNSQKAPESITKQFLAAVDLLDISGKDIGIPLDILASRAMAVGLDAQALRYSEMLYKKKNTNAEDLVVLYQNLGLQSAADTVLKLLDMKEKYADFAIRLGYWEQALHSYERRIESGEDPAKTTSARLECLEGLNRIADMAEVAKNSNDAYYKAVSAWYSFDKQNLINLGSYLDRSNESHLMYISIFDLLNEDLNGALRSLDALDEVVAPRVIASISDYNKCRPDLQIASTARELRHVIEILKARREGTANKAFEKSVIESWPDRFEQMSDSPRTMLQSLRIRSVLLSKEELRPYWLKFLEHTTKKEYQQLREVALAELGPEDPAVPFIGCDIEHDSGDPKTAIANLERLLKNEPASSQMHVPYQERLGRWCIEEGMFDRAMEPIRRSTELCPNDPHVWLMHSKTCFTLFESNGQKNLLTESLESAMRGLSLNPSDPMHYTLRAASLVYQHGNKEIYNMFLKWLPKTQIHYWLSLLTQIIARIAGKDDLAEVMQQLLINIANEHPIPVLYSLAVHYNSSIPQRHLIAAQIVDAIRIKFPEIVDSITEITQDLIRVSHSWYERWCFAIDEAARQYSRGSRDKAVEIIMGLFETSFGSPKTSFEVSFMANYGHELENAKHLLEDFLKTGSEESFSLGFSYCTDVLKQIKPIVSKISHLSLKDLSPTLAEVKDSPISIPGTYRHDRPKVSIVRFEKEILAVKSKQKPRKMSMVGSDGNTYGFLLKANEDTRLDERVMQLFMYINSTVQHSGLTNYMELTTYTVVPLSAKVGLIGWVPGCHTLVERINMDRNSRGINPMIELDAVVAFNEQFETAPQSERLMLYKIGTSKTAADEIERLLLDLANDSSHWLDRRTRYTSSLASTSVAGYILGLGDRHLANIMVDDLTSKLVHIDFGDCFEVAMHREGIPETVPFRLTRALVNGLGVCGLGGGLMWGFEQMMCLVRENADQIAALLEAFIYDPLLQWTLDGKQERPEIAVMKRIQQKIGGRDFGPEPLSVHDQAVRLVEAAMDPSNLSAMYRGWYPWI